jgi:hypothetical protein
MVWYGWVHPWFPSKLQSGTWSFTGCLSSIQGEGMFDVYGCLERRNEPKDIEVSLLDRMCICFDGVSNSVCSSSLCHCGKDDGEFGAVCEFKGTEDICCIGNACIGEMSNVVGW